MVSRQAAKKAARSVQLKEIFVHVEGGRNKSKDVEFRQGFATFFRDLKARASSKGIVLHFVLEQGRQQTFDRFRNLLGTDETKLRLMLIDAEGPVAVFGETWQHLGDRLGDGWTPPENATDEHVHLMAQTMEAWYFADPEGLERCFGTNGFNRAALPKTHDVEAIPKARHVESLNAAVKGTPSREYDKYRDAPRVLMSIDPAKVRARAAHCERFFAVVTRMIDEANG
ncbi:MAG TPA: DUF4276 family protein [Capsulimonadaceae bacterium]